MTRTRFHQGLDDLKQKLLTMGGMAEHSVERAVRAFQARDVEMCQMVLRDEPKINAAERERSEAKRWKDIWSAGHSVSGVADIPSVAGLVERTAAEYATTLKRQLG